jgi:hypothetical protein
MFYQKLRRLSLRMVVVALCMSSLTGCVAALALPAVGLANLAHKSGTMTVELEGDSNPISAFRTAAIDSGGTVPQTSEGFARAEFTNTDVKVEAQVTDSNRVQLRGASLSNVGRTYEFEDGITNTTQSIVDKMVAQGFTVVSSSRDRGV